MLILLSALEIFLMYSEGQDHEGLAFTSHSNLKIGIFNSGCGHGLSFGHGKWVLLANPTMGSVFLVRTEPISFPEEGKLGRRLVEKVNVDLLPFEGIIWFLSRVL